MNIKSIIAFSMATLMLVATPVSSFASNMSGNTGGGSTSTGTGSGGNSSPQTTSSEKQGYRFTFINNTTGERMSKTVDILRSDFTKDVTMQFFGSLIDKSLSQDTSNYNWLLYSEIATDIQKKVVDYTEMPWWYTDTGNTFTGNSDDFSTWLLSPEAQANLSGSILEEMKFDVYLSKKDAKTNNDYFELYTRKKQIFEDVKSVAKKYGSNKTQDWYDNLMTLRTYITGEYAWPTIFMPPDEMPSEENSALQETLTREAQEFYDNAGVTSYDSQKFYIQYISNLANFIYGASDMLGPINHRNMEAPELKTTTDKADDDSLVGKFLGDKTYKSSEFGYIPSLILLLDKSGNSVFALDDSGKSADEANAELLNSFLSNECSLVVESIMWCKPKGWPNGRNWIHEVYGTPRNWATYMHTVVRGNWDEYSDAGLTNFRAINQAFFDSMHLSYDEASIVSEQFNRAPFYSGKNYTQATDVKKLYGKKQSTSSCISFADMASYANTSKGVAMHIYAAVNKNDGIFDTSNPVPEESENPIKLVKYYQEVTPFNTVPISYYVEEKAPRNMRIGDESDKGWMFKGYFTSVNDYEIKAGNSIYEWTWDRAVKDNPTGTYAGKELGAISIPETAPDKTILMLYIRTITPPTETTPKDLTVIKVKEDTDGSSTVTKNEIERPANKVYDATEPEWEYVEDYTTPSDPTNPSNWEEVPKDGTHGGNPQIPVEETTKTVYIKYEKENAPDLNAQTIKLYGNELSYTYDLRDLLANRVLLSVYDSVPASPGTKPSCSGHTRKTGTFPNESTESYSCSVRQHHLPDGFWTVKVDNNFDYNSGTTFIREAQQIGDLGGSWGASTTGNKINFQKATPNLRFMLYRDSSKDRVTLYPEKNTALKSILSGLGIDSESYTPAGSRIARVGDKDKSFRNTFQTHFDYVEHDTGLSWKWERAKCAKGHGGEYSTVPVVVPEDLNNAYSKSGNIREWYLLGTENTGTEKPVDSDDASWINKYKFNHSYSQAEAEMSFYPYHKMLYRAHDDNSNPQAVYVTSENLSKMKVFNAVQTGVYKKSAVNANLDSTQWSTHARSLAFLNGLNYDKKSVLPGGGILNLDMGSKGDTVLGVRLWQTALPDEQVQAVQQSGFTTSVSKAKELATLYKQEVEATLGGYGLVQWGTEEITTESEDVLNSGEELHGNQSSSLVTGNGGKTSSDEKYYLKQDGSGSNRANLDVLGSRIDKQVVYTVKADVDGNLWVEKDGTLIGSKSKVLAEVLANSEVKLLDDNTKIVSNLYQSLDRNLGEYGKYSRRQGDSYCEAFDGVSVVLTDISFDLGFSTGGSKRTMVLDPMLLSTAESKSELYDFEEGKTRTSAFVTTEESTSGAGGVGYLGTLGADGTMGALSSGLGDIQSLVNSRVFFWSNFSVSDLN